MCESRTASNTPARWGKETRMNSLKHSQKNRRPLLLTQQPSQHSPGSQDECRCGHTSPSPSSHVGGWVGSGPTVLGRGLRGIEGVGVKGDHLPPGQRQSPARDASPRPYSLASQCLPPTPRGGFDSMTLAELTKKGPAELGAGGRTCNIPILGACSTPLPSGSEANNRCQVHQNSSLFKK